MAAIDKIYGTTEQWDEFWTWCKANLPSAGPYFRAKTNIGGGVSLFAISIKDLSIRLGKSAIGRSLSSGYPSRE